MNNFFSEILPSFIKNDNRESNNKQHCRTPKRLDMIKKVERV